MTLTADISAVAGSFSLDCSIRAPEDRTLALLGPNGAGKTTLLRALCGLLRVQRGRIQLGSTVLEDTVAATTVAPEHRRIGAVFQDQGLFPHMSVLDNVSFGLRSRGIRRRVARQRALQWLERTGATSLAARRPASLSGGERSRVALARALASEPRLLLMDEPLAAVDAAARMELRRLLREHLSSFIGPRILVTHDPLEAAAVADDVVVLERGRVTQKGTFLEVTAQPRSEWVARVAGLNLLRGRAEGGALAMDSGSVLATTSPLTGRVLAAFHATAVALHRQRPEGSPRNVLECSVESLERHGDRYRVRLAGRVPVVAEVTPAAVAELQIASGQSLFASIKATEIEVYPE